MRLACQNSCALPRACSKPRTASWPFASTASLQLKSRPSTNPSRESSTKLAASQTWITFSSNSDKFRCEPERDPVLFFVVWYLSPEEQGFYYTFTSLLAFQVLFDLSLPTVIANIASHEWACLRIDENGAVAGEHHSLKRLSALDRSSLRWFRFVATLFAFFLCFGGVWFLGARTTNADVLFPWAWLVMVNAFSLCFLPRTALLEGCNQMVPVHRNRFFQSLSASAATCFFLALQAGLWSLVAALIRSVDKVETTFLEARRIALSGRPGPVWIDFPLDIQWQEMLEKAVAPALTNETLKLSLSDGMKNSLSEIANLMTSAQSPLILAGHGVHLSDSEELLHLLCERHQIPAVFTWGGSDLLETSHPLNGGVIGVSGQRGANQLMFQADLILILGANLSQTQVGGGKTPYAPQAKKVVITHDRDQLASSSVQIQTHIEADLRLSLEFLISATASSPVNRKEDWLQKVSEARENNRKGSVDLDSRMVMSSGKMSSNIAVHLLSGIFQKTHHIVVDGGGTALYAGFQSAIRGKGKRMICSTGISSMGTGLAESVGVSLASGRLPILTIIGDGSFLMNIQDLASIAQHRLPVVIALINNAGYLAIRHTQRDYMQGRYYGTGEGNGLHIPEFEKIVEGFGLAYQKITSYEELEQAGTRLLRDICPVVLDIQVDPDQDVLFRPAVTFLPDGRSVPHDLSEMWPCC